ncbi:Hypothetical protein GbCGDNIH7_0493 [Granulibacter bethesdensis]|nr:Hypothetical protein GbCGDNIH7_0493 [Granulibacter bethesdensis]
MHPHRNKKDGGCMSGSEPPLTRRFRQVRSETERLSSHLDDEDQCIQSMPDASPVKWHRAHTSWFFETFILKPYDHDYEDRFPAFNLLFNSYYEAVGARHPRPQRGLLSRPSCITIREYRHVIDMAMLRLLGQEELSKELADLVELGLQHEQQHQELMVTDMLHAFAQSPLYPAMLPGWEDTPVPPPRPGLSTDGFITLGGGLRPIGHSQPGFSFDNETPAHDVFVQPYQLATDLVTNGDWKAFIAAGGYRNSTFWMMEGYEIARHWQAPLYWIEQNGRWMQMGPGGLLPLENTAPVRHISWYEADAYARWAGARLPTEQEWEIAASDQRLNDMHGRVWQWTASAYRPYPRFQPPTGAIGEYNGKFMINQMVLRGSSIATPASHARNTYRNFFHPDRRWQFSGLRLARDIDQAIPPLTPSPSSP